MDILLFTLVAAALYFFSDWILRTLEQRRGAPMPYRNVVFLAIILVLSVTSFQILQQLLQQSATG